MRSSFANDSSEPSCTLRYFRTDRSGELASATPKIDLIVCDEGHRLKSKDNKTTKMFDALSTKRRISTWSVDVADAVLSGTPLQNDLGEYWAMASFVAATLTTGRLCLSRSARYVFRIQQAVRKADRQEPFTWMLGTRYGARQGES